MRFHCAAAHALVILPCYQLRPLLFTTSVHATAFIGLRLMPLLYWFWGGAGYSTAGGASDQGRQAVHRRRHLRELIQAPPHGCHLRLEQGGLLCAGLPHDQCL